MHYLYLLAPLDSHFDVAAFAEKYQGYLLGYKERVEGDVLTGPQIIQLSVGARYWAESPDSGPEGWGARAQLTFLFQRADQLRGLTQLDMFRRPTIADFDAWRGRPGCCRPTGT